MLSLRSSFNSFIVLKQLKQQQQININRHIKRWVAPTLMELRKRKEKLGPEEPQRRSSFIEWNYRSELFAFGKRLGENFDLGLLQKAFTNRAYALQEEKRQKDLGIENAELNIVENTALIDIGRKIVEEYLEAYLIISLPKLPSNGLNAFMSFLTCEKTLSHIGYNLGMKDLIYSVEYPPSEETLAKTLLAVIGALKESSGEKQAFLFVRDFIVTQLNQKDLTDIWDIQDPENLLKSICKEKNLEGPEPRLIGDCAKNTVLGAFHVGVYSNKQLLGKGFGEDIPTAIKTASLDAVRTHFGISDNIRPFNFLLEIEKTVDQKIPIAK